MKKLILLIVLLLALSLSSCSLGHIEDTNGEENFELSTLTEADIFTYRSCTSVGTITSGTGNTFSFKCKKLSGKELIKTITPNNRTLNVFIDFEITSGNAYLSLIRDDAVYYEIGLNSAKNYTLSSGEDVRLVLLGESCSVSIKVEITQI